jgi:hypothetical protein
MYINKKMLITHEQRIEEFHPHDIFIFQDFLNADECNELRDVIDQCQEIMPINDCEFAQVECFEGHMDELILATEGSHELNSQLKKWDAIIYDRINDIVLNFFEQTNPYFSSETDSGFLLRRVFGKTDPHVDSPIIYDRPRHLRCMTLIIQLNDDFEGGVYHFPKHSISKRLQRGSLLAFPPYWTHPHSVSPVLNNTIRYTISTWLLKKMDLDFYT